MKKFVALIVLFCLMAGSLVFADGDSRLATQAEKDFTKTVLNVLAKAVPPVPAGWDITQQTAVNQVPNSVSTGSEKYPMQVVYSLSFQDTKRIQEAQMKLQEELMKLMKTKPNATGPEIEALSSKMEPRDVQVQIDVKANILYEGIYEKPFNPAPSVAGGLTYRTPSEMRSNTWREGCTFIFLGAAWKLFQNTGTYLETKVTPGFPHTTVRTIVVKVRADPNRAQQIVQKIDWDALKRLIR